MMRFLLLLFLIPQGIVAQQKNLLIEGNNTAFYIKHTVAQKENYYSIGRLYNISPKEIAPFNNLELEKGLSLNQVIKIPLTSSNFTQEVSIAADEALIPVYHVVKEKEGLYRVGANYNKLAVATIKIWNNLKQDNVANGTKLIVGYLKVKKELSAFAANAKPVQVVQNTTPVVSKPAEVVKSNDASDKVVEVAVAHNIPPKEPEKKVTPEPEKKETGNLVPVPVKEEKKSNEWTARNFNKAVFKKEYDAQIKQANMNSETGVAASFKSTSGWEDGKYYCLHNKALPGTVIKVTCSSTGKSIFAKVLDIMPDIKQNSDLILRLSNAATEELGAGENKFDCSIQYAQL